jgi:hypothetical protein
MPQIRPETTFKLIRACQIATLTLLATGLALLVIGCGAVPGQITSTIPQAGQTLIGNVHGGSQSVVGAHLYLFAAGTSGYGGPSISLLNPQAAGVSTDSIGTYVTTGVNGSFSIGRAYSCTPGQQVYLYARGGNPGLAAGTNNPALSLMAALGICPGEGTLAYAVPVININEVSTIAAAYALAGFMTNPTHLSAPATPLAQQGISNAFLTIYNLVDIPSGKAKSTSYVGNGVPPQATVNTLANMLASCINSTGATTTCTTLLLNARDASGIPPTDTATAALNIAHNPGANVSALFALSVPAPPFQPNLTFAPNDFTIGITFYSDTMAGPYYPAIDAAGNIWAPGYANNSITEFNTLGIPISGQGFTATGINQPFAIAIDSAQTAWIANYSYGATASVSHISDSGFGLPSFPCATNCTAVAIDAFQNVWASGVTGTTVVHNSTSALAEFATTGLAPSIAIDSLGRAWTLGLNRTLYRLTLPSSLASFPQTVTSALPNDLNQIAIDSNNNVWFTSGKNNALGRVDPTGVLVSPAAGYAGGGLSYPAQLAIDGANRVWVANRDGNSISAFKNDGTAISPATGYRPSGQLAPDPTIPQTAIGVRSPHGLAIDGSGNIWVTNFTANSVTEFVGLATPAVTPISATTHGLRP